MSRILQSHKVKRHIPNIKRTHALLLMSLVEMMRDVPLELID
jgi:hypothetical protein